MHHIDSVTPLEGAVLKLRYRDGFEGLVSIMPLAREPGVFAFLRSDDAFAGVSLGEDGRWIFWIDPDGDTVDLCADALRFEAEERAVRELAAAE